MSSFIVIHILLTTRRIIEYKPNLTPLMYPRSTSRDNLGQKQYSQFPTKFSNQTSKISFFLTLIGDKMSGLTENHEDITRIFSDFFIHE